MLVFVALKDWRRLHLCWVLGARQGLIFGRVCRPPTGNDSSGVVHCCGRIHGQMDPMQPRRKRWTLEVEGVCSRQSCDRREPAPRCLVCLVGSLVRMQLGRGVL
jgi:hypothetical protein